MILVSSLINEETNKMLKPIQRRIQRTHIIGQPRQLNEFTSKCKTDRYPQGYNQLHLHRTQYNVFTFLWIRILCITIIFL